MINTVRNKYAQTLPIHCREKLYLWGEFEIHSESFSEICNAEKIKPAGRHEMAGIWHVTGTQLETLLILVHIRWKHDPKMEQVRHIASNYLEMSLISTIQSSRGIIGWNLAPIIMYRKVKKMCKKWLCVEISYSLHFPMGLSVSCCFCVMGSFTWALQEFHRWDDWGDRTIDSKCWRQWWEGVCTAEMTVGLQSGKGTSSTPTIFLREELVLWYIRVEFMHKVIPVKEIVCFKELITSLSWVLLSTLHTACLLLSAGNHSWHVGKETAVELHQELQKN